MRVKVVFLVDQTTCHEEFTGDNIPRQLRPNGLAYIRFHDGVGRDKDGKAVLTVQYRNVEAIYTYQDPQ